MCHSATLAHSNTVISKSCDFPPSHLVIHAFHIPIIMTMQVPCQFLEPIAPNPLIYSCGFSLIIPPRISSSSYTSSLPWFYLQNHEGKPRNIWKILLVQLTHVRSKFYPISIRNLPLNSLK
jgi:hypothetical protein